MKFYLDTEFVEKPNTIDLISIGIVTETGHHYYAISKFFDIYNHWKEEEWLRENVYKSIYESSLTAEEKISMPFNLESMSHIFNVYGESMRSISTGVMEFVREHAAGTSIEFYGYYCDYDWVVFCWIFGKMIDLPKGFPMYCRDLKQMMDDRGLDKAWKRKVCPDPDGEHDALVDAMWNKRLHREIQLYDDWINQIEKTNGRK